MLKHRTELFLRKLMVLIMALSLASLAILPASTATANDSIVLRFLKFDSNPAWEQAATAFADQDAEVSQIALLNVQDGAENIDCSLADQFREWRWQYADLTALIQSDPQFNPADLFPGALESVTRDGQILGYPLAISPDVIRFDVDWFNRAGVPLPNSEWTTSDFVTTLQLLRSDSTMNAPFGTRSFPPGVDAIAHLVMADSALPVDATTMPPTLNLTQTQTRETIRPLLDLARSGYIDYPRSSAYSGQAVSFTPERYPMWSDSLSGGIWNASPHIPQRNLGTLLYPRGTLHAPVSYRVIAGYIRPDSLYPDACYRWFRYLAARPDVMGIPAHLSQATQYALLSEQGDSFLTFYETLRERASDPAARIPQHNYPSQFLAHINVRLERAYREYIFEGISLETVLSNAEQDTQTFLACISDIPEAEVIRQMSQADTVRYDGIIRECRRAYVPEIMWMYGG